MKKNYNIIINFWFNIVKSILKRNEKEDNEGEIHYFDEDGIALSMIDENDVP